MMRRTLLFLLCIPLCIFHLQGQEKEDADSLIRLLNAKKAQLIELDGKSYRKVEGPARFFHNNTYLLCDTAFWNVDEEYIDAIGHVQIIQENTVLTGDRLHYIIDQDLAQFRGHLVQLTDKDSNMLRTNNLDYNTKDSIAYFKDGASMKDKDGNIIESRFGKYESRLNLFTFINKVQMFSDSLFFVSDTMKYSSDRETAYFGKNTRGWKDDNYLASDGGWYNRKNETVFFNRNVYGQTEDYEVWCGDLYFDRVNEHCIMHKDIQLLDTLNGAIVLGEKLVYYNEPRSAEVTENPVFISIMKEKEAVDTAFIAGDTLKFYQIRMCDIDSIVLAAALERKALADIDAVTNVQQNMKQQSQSGGGAKGGRGGAKPPVVGSGGENKRDSIPVVDTLPVKDTLLPVADSLDAVVAAPDTARIVFVEAYHDVKVYKSDMQGLCDSLVYNGIDSMARLYTMPVLWNDIKNQLTSDSMQLVMSGGEFKKGLLLSNAFIATKETDKYFNQIKSPEMVGYFTDGELSRFDALGGASMLFYLAEDSVITTMNKKECKIISSRLKNGSLVKNYYYDNIKSDAYPVFDLPEEEQHLKDFNWRGDERPETRFDITAKILKLSIRQQTIVTPFFPLFSRTAHYFPGYIDRIMHEINERNPLKWRYGEAAGKLAESGRSDAEHSRPEKPKLEDPDIRPFEYSDTLRPETVIRDKSDTLREKETEILPDKVIEEPAPVSLTQKELRKAKRLEKKAQNLKKKAERKRLREEGRKSKDL